MNFCCAASTKIPSVTLIQNEYTRIEPHSERVFRQAVLHQTGKTYQKYKDWSRVKIKGQNILEIAKHLAQANEHFIDPDFPHKNSVLTQQYYHRDIEWMRVGDVVENAVFSKQFDPKALENIAFNKKQLQAALILIARTNPIKFKEFVSHTFKPDGLYEFKLFKDGLIQNIIIDDYIPTDNHLPIFVGPARKNQVYPMLIEKAMAKLFGGYDRIPQNVEIIMEAIFCGPVSKKSIIDLRQKQTLSKSIIQSIQRKELTILLSKREAKIRNYGINDNQVYNIVQKHDIHIDKVKQTIFQLVSESKMSAWNGKFCLNDDIWKRVEEKAQVFHSIKNNKSFCIGEMDIGKLFQDLLIFQSTETANKDWIQTFSVNDHPSFITFEVRERDRIFLRASTFKPTRQSIILARVIANNKDYQFIAGHFQNDSTTTEINHQLEPGTYLVCIFQEWFLEKKGPFTLFLSSKLHIYLASTGMNTFPNFLSKLFLNYETKTIKDQKEINRVYSLRLMIEETGFAYIHIKPQNSQSKAIKIQINQKKLIEDNWEILEPYKNLNQVVIANEANDHAEKLIILQIKDAPTDKKIYFPSTAFKIKE